MDDAVLVYVVERVRDSGRDPHRVVHRQLLFTIEPSAKTLALDERHYIVEESVRLSRVEERKKVRMLEIRRDADLAEKPLGAKHGAKLRIENLERDAPIVLDVASQVYGRHPAATNFTVE